MRKLLPHFTRLALMMAVILTGLCLALIGMRFPWLPFFVLGFIAWKRRPRWRGSGSSHGTARVADGYDLAVGGLLSEEGLILGTADLTDTPTARRGIVALFSPRVSSADAVRECFAALLG